MFRYAGRNLLSRPVRSLLALCGLTIAIMGMVGLFSVAQGIQATISKTFGRIPGLAIMQPGAPVPLFSRIPAAWAAEIEQLPGVHVVVPELWSRAHLVEGKPNFSPPRLVCGIDPERVHALDFSVYRSALQEGRFLLPSDRGTHRTVISRPIANQTRKKVGDHLRVDGYDLEIVGIYECGTLMLDVTIIIDMKLARELMRIKPESVCSYYVEPVKGTDRKVVVQTIRDHFRGRSLPPWEPSALSVQSGAGGANPLTALVTALLHPRTSSNAGTSNPKATSEKPGARQKSDFTSSPSIPPKTVADTSSTTELPLEVRTAEDWAREFEKFSSDLDLFLLIMTSIGVTIAVLGIVNTMLMSVTERIIEFGILKANGWADGDVLRLIACESALLGVSGGVLGCLLGWAGTLLINARWPTRIHLYASPGLLTFSLVFSIVVGILGGLYPAIWAARMRPMDAIRRG